MAVENSRIVKTITVHHRFSDEEITVRCDRDIYQLMPDDCVITIETEFADEYESRLNDLDVSETVTVRCNDEIIEQWEQIITIPKENNFFGRIIKFFRKLFHKDQ